MDYQALLYDPIYARLGVAGTIALDDSDGTTAAVKVIDKTAGVALNLGDTAVDTVKPAARVRMVELAEHDLVPSDIDGGTLTFNSKTWTIKGFLLLPSPNGEADGEALLFLIEDTVGP